MSDREGARRLGAILAADVAGYSRLMQGDDQATVAMLDVCREIFRESIEEHGGRVVDMAGDSVLAVFETATGAVHAACEIQGKLVEPNAGLPEERRMQFRIGINLGEVIEKTDGTLYGDGVNIAARLESLAEPGGVTISASVFDQVRNRLQLGLDFIGEQAVKNIAEPVRAYRIVGEEVASIASKPPSAGRGGTSGHRSLLLGSTVAILALVVGAWLWKTAPSSQPPSSAIEPVAVLPFKNLSGDPAQDYFADGITEELIGIFNHIEHMQIVGHSKTRALKGKEVDTQALGRELGARYLVEGSVRRIADVVRISSQLINTETGTQEWAETYQNDLNPNNILDVQHEIATRIAVAIGGDLGAVALQKLQVARLKAPEDLSAYECHLRYRRYQNTLTADAHKVARDCLEQVVEAEPQYAQAWIDLVQIYVDGDRLGYDERPGGLDRALEAARRAEKLDPQDPWLMYAFSFAYFFRGERDAFIAAAERAVEANPSVPNIIAGVGLNLAYVGQWEKGLKYIQRARQIERDPPGWWYFGEYFDHYRKGEYEAALEQAHKVNLPDYVWANALLAAAYGQLGRVEEAKPYVTRILKLNPDFEKTARQQRYKWFRFQEPLLDQFIDGLRKTGLKIPPNG